MTARLANAGLGVVFGFALSRIGFTSWDEVHRMFTFTDLRLTMAFGLAVVVLGIAWFVHSRLSNPDWPPRPIHKGTLAGGILFGIGWALSGACPSIALVQLGEGQLGAIVTLAGVLVGNAIYGWMHPRYFGWTVGSCMDD